MANIYEFAEEKARIIKKREEEKGAEKASRRHARKMEAMGLPVLKLVESDKECCRPSCEVVIPKGSLAWVVKYKDKDTGEEEALYKHREPCPKNLEEALQAIKTQPEDKQDNLFEK